MSDDQFNRQPFVNHLSFLRIERVSSCNSNQTQGSSSSTQSESSAQKKQFVKPLQTIAPEKNVEPNPKYVSTIKLKYKEPGISSKDAIRKLEAVQTYASRRGELKLFGLISDSLNEVNRILGDQTLTKKQSNMKQFFDPTDQE